jgi:hypothetical protein
MPKPLTSFLQVQWSPRPEFQQKGFHVSGVATHPNTPKRRTYHSALAVGREVK